MTDIKNGARILASIFILPPSRWFAMEALKHDDGVHDTADLGLPLGITQLDEWTPMQEQQVVVKEARAAGMAMDRCRLGGLFMDAAGFTKQ